MLDTATLEYWENKMLEWEAEAREMMSDKRDHKLIGVKYALGSNLKALVDRLRKELETEKAK